MSRHPSVKPIERKMSSVKQRESYGHISTSPRARNQSRIEQSSVLPDLIGYELDIERSYDAKGGRTKSTNTKVFNDGIAQMKIEQ
jgi:hypothetical protein